MSFIGVLRSIGHVIGVGATVATRFDPIIEAIPGFGPGIVTILGAITAVEKLIPQDGAGPAKKPIVTAIVNAATPGIDPVALGKAIDEIVAAFNALQTAFGKVPSPQK